MTTQALFREDAYLTQCEAIVQAVGDDGIRLDRTCSIRSAAARPATPAR